MTVTLEMSVTMNRNCCTTLKTNNIINRYLNLIFNGDGVEKIKKLYRYIIKTNILITLESSKFSRKCIRYKDFTKKS